jgi:hypothetical protein
LIEEETISFSNVLFRSEREQARARSHSHKRNKKRIFILFSLFKALWGDVVVVVQFDAQSLCLYPSPRTAKKSDLRRTVK